VSRSYVYFSWECAWSDARICISREALSPKGYRGIREYSECLEFYFPPLEFHLSPSRAQRQWSEEQGTQSKSNGHQKLLISQPRSEQLQVGNSDN